MSGVLVNAWMPDRDHIEPIDFQRRLEDDELFVLFADEARWNERDQIVRLQYFRNEKETR